jgi:hypothetical protein
MMILVGDLLFQMIKMIRTQDYFVEL